jgi:hypothetical protein
MSSLKETISLNGKNYGIGEGRLLELDTEGEPIERIPAQGNQCRIYS